jgi:AbrB family looped-hinge helix DNA binding protein
MQMVVVKKLGANLAVVIPKAMARKMNLREGSLLEVSADASGILLRRGTKRQRRPLKEIVAQLDPAAYRRHSREFANDNAVGKEFW